MELKSAKGRVEATAQNSAERYGLKLAGSWYNGFGQCPAERGDEIQIDYVENGEYRNLENVRHVDSESELGVRMLDANRDERVVRCVALKCATTLFASEFGTVEEVLNVAERLEQWLLRAK
jgi:hypothetical protein